MNSKPSHNVLRSLDDAIRSIGTRASGGIGRRAGFRCLCPSGREGSSPFLRTLINKAKVSNRVLKLLFGLLTVLFSAFLANSSFAQEGEQEEINSHSSDLGPDFNGDGYGDIVVGATGERFGDAIRTGAVTIVFGDSDKSFSDSVILHQGLINVFGENEPNDKFGSRTTYGDFNGDGLDDLVITAPKKDVHGIEDAGMIWVLEGIQEGMGVLNIATAFDLSMFSENDFVSPDAQWGEMVSAGDFNGDTFYDLAISAPNSAIDGKEEVGLCLLYTSPSPRDPKTSRMPSSA